MSSHNGFPVLNGYTFYGKHLTTSIHHWKIAKRPTNIMQKLTHEKCINILAINYTCNGLEMGY